MAAPLLVTLLRVASVPATRRYCDPREMFALLAAPFTAFAGGGNGPVTAATRLRWAACRHLLVMAARTCVCCVGDDMPRPTRILSPLSLRAAG